MWLTAGMASTFCRSLLALTLALPVLATAQDAPKPLSSHEINADNSITFRYRNASATKVEVSTDASLKPLAMTRDDSGVWSVTTASLTPEIYSYTFHVDGVDQLDPRNGRTVPNLVALASNVLVPGTPAGPWELTAVPHGALETRLYTTHVAKNLPEGQESYVVYTPPSYDAKKKGGYPVLYLLHGWSDDATGWSAVGRANLILDTLLAQQKIVPMIVVMPMGYGNYDFVTHGGRVWDEPAKVNDNTDTYEQMLEQEIMPAVDREYNIAKGRQNHAISGLSMGGLETLAIGLRHPDQFAYVAGMSSAVHNEGFDALFPNIDAKKANYKLFWVSCGVDDHLIQPNRDFVAWAKAKGFDVDAVETPGAHTWLVWRDNLMHIAPMLFR
jgi:enterochelin esterase-like enzyme